MVVRALALSLCTLACTGCAVLLPGYSFKVDQAKLMRMYRKCVEEHYGTHDLGTMCEPIVSSMHMRHIEKVQTHR